MAHVKKAHPFIPQRGHTSLKVSRSTRKGTDTILATSSGGQAALRGGQSRPACHPARIERGWIP